MPSNLDGVLEGVVSHSMARKNDATEKVIYNKARENMARAARRLARKAQVKYRADLETELRKLAIESAKELQVARKSFQQEPEDEEDPESNDIAANDDSFVNSLLAANMDILNEFHVIGGTGDVEPKGPDSASSVKSADRDNALPKIPEQLIQQDMYPESDDGKNWMRDNDDSEDEGHGGARLDGPNLLGGEVEPETLGSGGSIVSKVALRTPAASSTSRKPRQRSFRKMVIDSDEPDHIQQTTPSITTTNSSEKSNKGVQTGRSSRYSLEISKPKTPQAPKSPRLMPHRPMWDSQSTPTRPTPLRSKFRHRPHSRGRGRSHSPVNFEESSDKARKEESFSYRKRSPVGPAASQPVRIRKASGTKKDQFSYRRLTAVGLAATQPVTGSRRSPSTPPPLCRKHPKRELPVRKSTLSVHTYSDKKLFRNMVGTLSGPDYYGY